LRNPFKEAREKLGLTLNDVAKATGYGVSTINNAENGITQPSARLRASLEQFLNISPSGKTTAASKKGSHFPVTPAVFERAPLYTIQRGSLGEKLLPPRFKAAPVVSWASAGAARDYHDLANYLDEVVPTECADPNCFAVIVDGDSMEPLVLRNDRIIVAPSIEARSGDMVIARTAKAHEVLFKKFYRCGARGETVRLVSVNKEYPDREFKLKDLSWIYPVVGIYRCTRMIT
jgi:phage repressor protein C with HTH and peptisase S24 domain